MAEPGRWKEDLRGVAAHAEDDLRRVVKYINDEVVPDIRRNGSHALRVAASELQKLAQRMDDGRAETGPQPPPPAADKDPRA